MWAYNDQTASGTGCIRKEICTNNATYLALGGERQMQWFCTEEQFAENKGAESPWPDQLIVVEEKQWEEFGAACETHADCPRPDLG